MNLRGLGLLVFAGAALLLQLSCAATVLAPAEEKVRITENANDVKGCQALGPVEARGPYKVPDEWKIQFRDQGLQLGADTVVLNHFSVLAQSFSGMAYRCAQAAAAETAAPAVVPAPPPAPVADAVPMGPVFGTYQSSELTGDMFRFGVLIGTWDEPHDHGFYAFVQMWSRTGVGKPILTSAKVDGFHVSFAWENGGGARFTFSGSATRRALVGTLNGESVTLERANCNCGFNW